MTEFREKRRGMPSLEDQPLGYFLVVPAQVSEDAFDLRALAVTFWQRKVWLIMGAVIGAVIAFSASFLMPNIYRSKVVAAPVVQGGGNAGSTFRSQFGGLAALAGIDFGSGGGGKDEAIATLRSDGFVRDFIETEGLLPILFSGKWDAIGGKWRDGVRPPSLEDARIVFMKDVLSVVEDKKTGLIIVEIEWSDARLSALWANRMVELVNERLRQEAIQKARQSIGYLNQELANTEAVDLRQAIYRLIESQINNAMLASVQREYAFRVIDMAVPPERRISPRRRELALLGAFLGVSVAGLLVLLRKGAELRRNQGS